MTSPNSLPQPSQDTVMNDKRTTVIEEIAAERQRQMDAEGWTLEHDDAHSKGELAQAAGVYALSAGSHDYRWVLQGLPVNDYLAAAMKLWPGTLNVRDEIVTRILDLSVIGRALSGFTDVEGDIFTDELRDIVTNALAASPSSPASGVRVKALEWVQNWHSDPLTGFATVDHINRTYTVDHDEPRFYASTNVSPSDYSGDAIGNYGTFDEAKAACQADYEARILSAIGEHP